MLVEAAGVEPASRPPRAASGAARASELGYAVEQRNSLATRADLPTAGALGCPEDGRPTASHRLTFPLETVRRNGVERETDGHDGLAGGDPVTFLSVAGLFLAVAAAASLLPTLRIARLDPVQTLRNDC